MNTNKLIQLKERADKAYALSAALAQDTNQSSLVMILSREARNHISAICVELDQALNRRNKK